MNVNYSSRAATIRIPYLLAATAGNSDGSSS
jgi:hypothetical protein